MGDAERAREWAAIRGCERVLSHRLRESTAEQLTRLQAAFGRLDGSADARPDFYGDGVVAELERRVAELLGSEEAVFFPTGTMAQQVALRCWAGRTGNPVVALHPLSHPEVHERRALTSLAGLRTVHPATAPRPLRPEEIRDMDEPFGTLLLELPMRDAGFVLPSWEELTATVEAARERDAVVHFDGARLWECGPHFGRPPAEVAGLADSVYVSFYKSLGGLGGAALACPADLAAEARAWRHRHGGALFRQWPAALTALAGLDEELPRLPEYVAHAKTVAAAVREALDAAGLPWWRVHPEVPHTHQFQVWLPYSAGQLEETVLTLAEETRTSVFGWWTEPGLPPGVSMTEMTVTASALEWTAEDVKDGVAWFVDYLRR